MKGSGLSECLQMVYGKNTIIHILSRKVISRSLRAHFLLQSAPMLNVLTYIIQEQLIAEEDLAVIKAFFNSFVNGDTSVEDIVESEILEKVHGVISKRFDYISTASRTAKLWVQYIRYIDIIKCFIAAERRSNWKKTLGKYCSDAELICRHRAC